MKYTYIRGMKPSLVIFSAAMLLGSFTLPAFSANERPVYEFKQPDGKPIDYVFKSGDDGYKCFRIPAIVKTKKGTLVAFAEGRVNGSGDAGNIDIVAKRSTDGGKTWSKIQVVQDDENKTCGNPAPVVDQRTGRIILLTCGSAHHEGAIMDGKGTREVYVQYSDDDGKTWSKRKDVTSQARKPEWRWYATGPCSGIQIMEGKYKGRLVIPANHSDPEKKYFAHCFYSDDKGNTWKLGSTAGLGSNESQIAELGPAKLVHNMRMQNNSKGFRGVRYSKDGGATWTELEHEEELPCPRCQASLVRDYTVKDTLFFSNPAAMPRTRKGMAIRTSRDGGKTWPYKKDVYEGYSGYSNLVVLDKGTVGLLFEGGPKDLADGIAFCSFKKSELLTPRPEEDKPKKK